MICRIVAQSGCGFELGHDRFLNESSHAIYLKNKEMLLCITTSGVFKGRRARRLPRAPLFGGPPWSVTRV